MHPGRLGGGVQASRVRSLAAQVVRNLRPAEASDGLRQTAAAHLTARPAVRAGDRVALGPLTVSRLALGTGSGGWNGASNQTRRLGVEGVADLLQYGYEEHGINFWDSADQYGSHPHLAAGLRRVPRDKVVVLTKTVATTAEAMRADLDRFRRELGTDVIDILLLHCMTDAAWPQKMRPVMDVISEARERGVVRMHGVSCHSFAALQAAVTEPWVEVDLARINPRGREMDAGPDEVVPVLQALQGAGKGVIGMKILGAGPLAREKAACLRFVLGLECVDCFSIGFESRGQLDEIAALIAGESAAGA